jgi:threonylcarbamoyladenosine tRNA methylthiotransferase MtaB
MKPSYAVATLGCKTNQFESAAMAEQLERAGFRSVDFAAGADLVVINSCTVTGATDSQSRNLIRRARRLNPQARIIVTGCYAQVDPDRLANIPGVSVVLGNQEKLSLDEHLAALDGAVRVADISACKTVEALSLEGFEQRSRAFVQIQNGCDAYCTYCIIPYARGPSRSVRPDAVVGQIKRLVQNGYPEIVLTGIHIGQYGQDLEPATDLLTLLRQIEASTVRGRLRLGSIEPTEFSADLSRYIAQADWICPHFHIPLQAGHADCLTRMNRHYSPEFYADLLCGLECLCPDAAIGADVIAGFPGENEAEFAATFRLIEQLPISHLHVFPYSRRAGTPAADLPRQVPPTVIKERAAELRRLGEQKYGSYAERFIGKQLELVIEGGEVAGQRKGLSRHYLSVQVPAHAVNPGELVTVVVTAIQGSQLFGVPI